MQFTWKQHKTYDDFAAVAEQTLLFDKFQNGIMLRVINANRGNPADENTRLVTVHSGSQVAMVGFQVLPHQMLYYFPRGEYNKPVLRFYIENLINNNWSIHQIQGDQASAKKFAEIYAHTVAKKTRNRENLIAYRLGGLAKPNMPPGNFRQCTLADMNVLPYWGTAFYIECDLQDHGKDLAHHLAETPKTIDTHYVWVVDGHPVAMCNWAKVSDDCVRISAVYTTPTARGKGYAYGLVWSLCNLLAAEYPDIMLYANADYPQSNKCYQRVGFKPLFVNSQYVFE